MLPGSVKDLRKLEESAPGRAAGSAERAREAVSRLSKDFPGDPDSGLLNEGEEAERRFAEFANEEPCPALDPLTGTLRTLRVTAHDLPRLWTAGALGRWLGSLRTLFSRRYRRGNCSVRNESGPG